MLPNEDRDLDKRRVEAAHRLERSVGAAMTPQLLDALNARLDEIGRKVAEALDAAPKPLSLDPIERQISDMASSSAGPRRNLPRSARSRTRCTG